MALETIVVIAERADVPPSSLIRFAKSFGFNGFREMQKVFQQGLVKSSSDYRKRVQTLNRQLSQQGEVALSNLENLITEELKLCMDYMNQKQTSKLRMRLQFWQKQM